MGVPSLILWSPKGLFRFIPQVIPGRIRLSLVSQFHLFLPVFDLLLDRISGWCGFSPMPSILARGNMSLSHIQVKYPLTIRTLLSFFLLGRLLRFDIRLDGLRFWRLDIAINHFWGFAIFIDWLNYLRLVFLLIITVSRQCVIYLLFVFLAFISSYALVVVLKVKVTDRVVNESVAEGLGWLGVWLGRLKLYSLLLLWSPLSWLRSGLSLWYFFHRLLSGTISEMDGEPPLNEGPLAMWALFHGSRVITLIVWLSLSVAGFIISFWCLIFNFRRILNL